MLRFLWFPTMSLAINQPQTPRNLIEAALAWLSAGDSVALLTLVAIEGNAPYPIGSQMLVNQEGRYLGQITGGCAEKALAEQAVEAIRCKQNQTQRYGLNSPFFDIQLPCGSGIDVYLEVDLTANDLREISNKLSARQSVHRQLNTDIGNFTKKYHPNERLIVVGQGPILTSLTALACQAGFEVLCVAQDADNAARVKQSGFVACSLAEAKHSFVEYCDAYTGLVSVFHEHQMEAPFLASALQTNLFYVGALGSRKTQLARLADLASAGCSAQQTARVFGPVGADIKAATPAHIAISILAQVIENLPRDVN